jgi:hypothetical protein
MPLVTVEDESIGDLFFLLCLSDRAGNQRDRVVTIKGVGNNKAIIKIFDD